MSDPKLSVTINPGHQQGPDDMSIKVPLKDCKIFPKYENVKSSIDRFKKEEFFRRIKPALLTKLVEESELEILLLDIRDLEDYKVCHIKGAISYPAVNLKKSVNYFSADILSFINKEPHRIIVIYDEDEYVMASIGNLFFEKGVDNIFVLHGGLKEVVTNYSFMLEGVYPKPIASPSNPSNTLSKSRAQSRSSSIRCGSVGGGSGSKPITPNWISKNKKSCAGSSGLSTPASWASKDKRANGNHELFTSLPQSGSQSQSQSQSGSWRGEKLVKQSRPGWGYPPSRSSSSVVNGRTPSNMRGGLGV